VSPLPGHLIAQTGHAGRLFIIAMLAATAVGVLASLIIRPPRHVPAAAVRLIVAMTLMFLLAPATRFGYFIYPGGILAWLIVSAFGQRARQAAGDIGLPSVRPGGPGPDGTSAITAFLRERIGTARPGR
jgi:hypothetical protein